MHVLLYTFSHLFVILVNVQNVINYLIIFLYVLALFHLLSWFTQMVGILLPLSMAVIIIMSALSMITAGSVGFISSNQSLMPKLCFMIFKRTFNLLYSKIRAFQSDGVVNTLVFINTFLALVYHTESHVHILPSKMVLLIAKIVILLKLAWLFLLTHTWFLVIGMKHFVPLAIL